MPKTLGQEPQIQMYERENKKRKYTMPMAKLPIC